MQVEEYENNKDEWHGNKMMKREKETTNDFLRLHQISHNLQNRE